MEYTKQNFKSGQILTAEALNNMDSSLESAVNELNNKQEKITDGSIPLSALANDVKDKIENAGADWNAQDGEAGYIDNKPFGVYRTEDVYFGDNIWETNGGAYLYVAESSHNGHYIDDAGYFRFDNGDMHTFMIDGAGEITVKNYGGFPIITNQDCFDTEEEANEFLNAVLKIVFTNKLHDAFISDSVLKTTPQELSNNEKTQIKENLGISTPDWNAQDGEAGYIENKTHYAYFTRIEYDQENNRGIYEVAGSVDKLLLLWRNAYFTVYENIPLTIDVYGGEDTFTVNYNGTTLFITDTYGYLKNEYEYISVSEDNIPLTEIFIPDTVVKTTPQTLSTAVKNQALSNLGIDPVVWQYMCEPYVYSEGTLLPSDLRSIIEDEDGYLNNLTFKVLLFQMTDENDDMIVLPIESITAGNGVNLSNGATFYYSAGEFI